MDGFNIIQHFFTRMRCHQCSVNLQPDGVELVRREKGVYVVRVHCMACDHAMGVALVGVETEGLAVNSKYVDPELPPEELERLSVFAPIDYDDVIAAHDFFMNLGPDWMRHLPSGMLLSETTPERESPAA